ncbi:MAG: EamA family transporter [Dehalococcoidia bacterium]
MLAIALAISSALGFGSAAIFARLGLQDIRPIPGTLISGVASFLPTLVLALIFALSDLRSLPLIAYVFLLGHGALTYIGGRGQNLLAIDLIGAARSGPFVGSSALFSTLFAATIAGERLHPVVALGTVAVVIGLIFSSGDLWHMGWRLDRNSLLGYALALGAAASYGASNIVAKELSLNYGSPLVIAAWSTLFGTLLLTPFSGREAMAGLRTARGSWGFLALTGLAAALAVVALYFGFLKSSVVVVAPISSTNPLITLLLAHLFLARLERVTRWLLAGTFLAVAGVALIIVGSTL